MFFISTFLRVLEVCLNRLRAFEKPMVSPLKNGDISQGCPQHSLNQYYFAYSSIIADNYPMPTETDHIYIYLLYTHIIIYIYINQLFF